MSDMDELVGSLDEFRTLDSHNNPTNINQNNNYMTENDAFDENNQLVATTNTNDGNVGYPMESCFGDEIEREAGGSIAERRAATCGFSGPMIDIARFKSISPLYSSSIVAQTSPYITIPAGISPTELLDSSVMLRYSQAPPSPTTGSYQLSPLNCESATLDYMNPSISIPRGFEQPAEFPGFVKNPDTELSSDFENSKDKIDHFASQSCFEGDQQGSSSALKISEDGYNWRKYGQKLVKGCEFPRSYYKCTHPNCLVKKKVERSLYGDVAEINYKGSHNHSRPQPNHRSNSFAENGGVNELRGEEEKEGGGIVWRNIQPRVDSKDAPGENLDAFSTAQMKYEVAGAHESSSRLVGHDEDDGKSLEGDAYLDESESKRRKIDLPIAETSVVSRGVREPRLLVQIKSDVDILDDGYRWRKYGQKVVKGNPNPRSYYKCTSPGCPVRKHVERACNDYKFVITAYDGKHDHTLPVAKSTTSAVAQPPYANAPKSSEPQIQHLSRRIDRIPDLGHGFMSSALNMYPLHFPNLQNPMGYNNSYNDGGMPSFPTSFLYDVPRPPPMMMPHGVNLYNMPAPVPSSSVVGQQQPVENDLDITTPKQEKI